MEDVFAAEIYAEVFIRRNEGAGYAGDGYQRNKNNAKVQRR